MPQSRERKAQYQREYRVRRREERISLLNSLSYMTPLLGTNRVKSLKSPMKSPKRLRKADVKALRLAGIDPETINWKAKGRQVSFAVYSYLLRDRNALKAHLAWHHDSVTGPDIGTRLERMEADNRLLHVQNTLLEVDLARLEVMIDSMLREDSRDGL